MKIPYAVTPVTPAIARPSLMLTSSVPIQVEMSMIPATGAAVESTMYASFSREMRYLSQSGLMIGPMINAFA